MSEAVLPRLVDRAAAPYRRRGSFAWHFARGKLGRDPVFTALLRAGLFDRPTHILDLGCGQALLANWIDAAHRLQAEGRLPGDWPTVARYTSYRGVELMPADVARSAGALPEDARVECADMCRADFGRPDRIVILDVLHYVDFAAQLTVLDRIRAALDPEGVFILRVGDRAAGWRYGFTRLCDQLVMAGRGHGWVRLYCRPLAEWIGLLEARGFQVEGTPMSTGTPFANMLLIARPVRPSAEPAGAFARMPETPS